jgi:hypothetical protein
MLGCRASIVDRDRSDLSAYGNAQRFLSQNGPERKKFLDADASWGHRSTVSTRKPGGVLRIQGPRLSRKDALSRSTAEATAAHTGQAGWERGSAKQTRTRMRNEPPSACDQGGK